MTKRLPITSLMIKSHPLWILTVYGHSQEKDSKGYFLEQQKVYKNEKDGYQLGAAQPLSKSLLVKLTMSVSKNIEKNAQLKSESILDGTLLYLSLDPLNSGIAFFDRPCKREITFSDNRKKKVTIHTPTTVYIGRGSSVQAFFCFDALPNKKTILYDIPLPNITAGTGNICNGSAKLHIQDRSSLESIMQGYRILFWEPAFNGKRSLEYNSLLKENEHLDRFLKKTKMSLQQALRKQFNNLNDNDDDDEDIDF